MENTLGRERLLRDENNAESLKNEIIVLLKEHNLSLSQTRTLFREIVEDIEDSPLNNDLSFSLSPIAL